ncbi:MAG: pentapeptide repeat-containing protein [Streptosporangiaceae bacterium]
MCLQECSALLRVRPWQVEVVRVNAAQGLIADGSPGRQADPDKHDHQPVRGAPPAEPVQQPAPARGLNGARLNGARLNGARLNGARLNGARLNGARCARARGLCRRGVPAGRPLARSSADERHGQSCHCGDDDGRDEPSQPVVCGLAVGSHEIAARHGHVPDRVWRPGEFCHT